MDHLSYRRHRFPPALIQHAIWLYLRFTPSYRDDRLSHRLIVAMDWLWSYLTFQRGARIITGGDEM
jgi:transposase-like protein